MWPGCGKLPCRAVNIFGLLAGQDLDDGTVVAWAASADRLYGADSAGERLCRLGFRPVVVGDLDSARPWALERAERVVLDPSQDTTDADKLFAQIARDGHSRATFGGFEGDRLDHLLASLASLARSGLDARIVLRSGMGWLVRPGREAAPRLEPGTTVSLLPVGGAEGLRLTGVRWPFQGCGASVSNVATGDVRASVESGAALLTAVLRPPVVPEW